mmetsp:Transcript_10589/g.22436  ORF Transcript_10589/g.22436 Transcript_10589/m.22436 type:complete len:342 (+) Transcript_10589:1454-2479(+)
MLPSPAGYSAKSQSRSVLQIARAAVMRFQTVGKARGFRLVLFAGIVVGALLVVTYVQVNASTIRFLKTNMYFAKQKEALEKEWNFPLQQHTLMQSTEKYSGTRNLVIVAGHAIFNGHSFDSASLANESLWTLLPFQRGQTPAYLDHIRAGVQEANRDKSALLLFSGGQTRQSSGPQSEAQNYWAIADALNWYGYQEVRSRALTEEFSRDSFENLLFSVCRFHEITQRYPTNITMVSFGFKRERFQNIHASALRFPPQRFHFIAAGDQFVSSHSESSNAAGPFSKDPYGCRSQVLRDKRRERNPFNRYIPYPEGCQAIAPLFAACTSTAFDGGLPWDIQSPS